MKVASKRENNRLLMAGAFGNTIPDWLSIDDVARSGFRGQVALRSFTPGFKTVYFVDQSDLTRVLADAQHRYPGQQFYWSGMTSDDHMTLQGEFVDGMSRGSFVHRNLTYSTVKKPMKVAFGERTQYAHGAAAELILRTAMDTPSHEWFMALRERYPDAAIEFSCWCVPLGTLGWNTVFWEVRDY